MADRTPVTPEGLHRYDNLPAVDAVKLAWTQAGPNPGWHREVQRRIHDEMPLLARALDRLAREE